MKCQTGIRSFISTALPWIVILLVVGTAAVALGIGASPRYAKDLRVGGGADVEQDGNILTDGDVKQVSRVITEQRSRTMKCQTGIRSFISTALPWIVILLVVSTLVVGTAVVAMCIEASPRYTEDALKRTIVPTESEIPFDASKYRE